MIAPYRNIVRQNSLLLLTLIYDRLHACLSDDTLLTSIDVQSEVIVSVVSGRVA